MKTYIPSKNYHPKETREGFIERLKKESREKQFIPVDFNGKKYAVLFLTSGFITTSFGRFQVVPAKVLFERWGWHHVLVYPDLEKALRKNKLILRIDSGCYTGMVLGDNICDCKAQLENVQKLCVKNNGGVIVHIPEQDGKGYKYIEWVGKRLYDELGMSEKEAMIAFYGKEELADLRTYEESVIILKALGFKGHTFNVATSNPKKIKALKNAGIKISGAKSL